MVELHLAFVFASALAMSLGHCAFMCGGIVIAYSNMIPSNMAKSHTFIAHSLYNFGRLVSYVIIGVLFALLGRGVVIFSFLRESMHIIVGALLIFYAVCLVFFPRILRAFEPNITQSGIFMRLFGRFLRSSLRIKYFFIGILNGFLPCGLVYFFALSTLNAINLAINPIIAAICIMSVFWLATLLPILSIGAISSFLREKQKHFLWLQFGLMIGFGLLNIYQGLNKI